MSNGPSSHPESDQANGRPGDRKKIDATLKSPGMGVVLYSDNDGSSLVMSFGTWQARTSGHVLPECGGLSLPGGILRSGCYGCSGGPDDVSVEGSTAELNG